MIFCLFAEVVVRELARGHNRPIQNCPSPKCRWSYCKNSVCEFHVTDRDNALIMLLYRPTLYAVSQKELCQLICYLSVKYEPISMNILEAFSWN